MSSRSQGKVTAFREFAISLCSTRAADNLNRQGVI